MRTRQEIEHILSAEVTVATLRHKEAVAKFHSVIARLPGGLPQPDGTILIEDAGTASRVAFESLRMALDRFNGLIIRGIVPDDLR